MRGYSYSPELRAAGLIVAGLMVAPSAPLGWVEYIRATMRCCTSGGGRDVEKAVPAERRVLI